MRNAETVLGVIHRSLESCLRSKDSRAVRGGADGKVPTRATRRRPTLLQVRFGGGQGVATPSAYPAGGSNATALPDRPQRTGGALPQGAHQLCQERGVLRRRQTPRLGE